MSKQSQNLRYGEVQIATPSRFSALSIAEEEDKTEANEEEEIKNLNEDVNETMMVEEVKEVEKEDELERRVGEEVDANEVINTQ